MEQCALNIRVQVLRDGGELHMVMCLSMPGVTLGIEVSENGLCAVCASLVLVTMCVKYLLRLQTV